MKLRDRATTCIHCGAYEVVGTDPYTSRLRIEESRACTCPATTEPEVVDLPAVCVDCGEPCRANAQRCTGCKNERDKYYRIKSRAKVGRP